MNCVAIIQARMGSSRFPGKIMQDICGQPLIGHVIDRVRQSRATDTVVVATTDLASDDILVPYLQQKNVRVVRGACEDVLDRFYQAATAVSADVVVRITADDPFKDPEVIDTIVGRLLADSTIDYVSNTIAPTFPEGLDVEAVRMGALAAAWRGARLQSDREHVTPYIWRQPDLFKVLNVTRSPDLSHMRWTLDYEEDLAFTRAVYSRLYHGEVFRTEEILTLLKSDPSIERINAGFVRNAGYIKSLKNDNPTML